MPRRLAIVIVCTVVAAACGGGGGGDGAGGVSTPAVPVETEQAGGQTQTPAGDVGSPPVALEGEVNDHGTVELGGETSLDLTLGDFFFEPTFVRAEPGTSVQVTATNDGSAPHTFTIDALGIDETLQPGDTVDVTVDLPQEGAVVYYCRFHDAQGMKGAFFFEAGDAPADATGGAGTATEAPEDTGY